MRTPTPSSVLYAWHAEAMAGIKPVITDTPQCGWFGAYWPRRRHGSGSSFDVPEHRPRNR